MELDKLKKLMAKGRLKAIIKEFPGNRRMLIGVERKSKASRKRRVAHIFARPIDMAELNKKPEPEQEGAQ